MVGKQGRKGKKLALMGVAALCVLSVLVAGARRVYADPTITDLTEERDETQEALEEVNATLEELAQEQEDIEAQISEVSEALVQVMADIAVIEGQIGEKEIQIEEASQAYQEALQRESDQYEAMKVRIRYMYEQGEVSYASLLLEAQSFSDLLTKADYIEQLYAYDRQMLAAYQETVQEVADLRSALESEYAALLRLQTDYEEEQAYQEGVMEELRAVSDDYAAEIAIARAQAQEYARTIEAQNAEIARLEEEERRRIEEEARRRAEEEAARRAAEEAARQAERETATENASSQVADSQTTGVVRTGSAYTVDVSSIYAASGSDLGKSIAVYACQFLGNPYVAGGTSLTNGADCSGFVFSVYKEFGYKVPRTSYELRSAGSEVSYDAAQPGDVICYPGHVAIYIGNGMIVHASSAKTGIKISNANYRSWLTIRRII